MIIVGLSCLGYLLVNAEPIILFKRYIGLKEEKYDDLNEIYKFIYRLLSCVLCLTFWVSLIYTEDILQAAMASILGELINRIMYRL